MEELARRFGTPLFVYDADTVRDRLARVQAAFDGVPLLVAYSVKANGNLSLLRLLSDAGAGADIVSGGELYRALRAGVPPDRIVFAGVGKTEPELQEALEAGVQAINVESAAELQAIERLARSSGRTARIALRVNLDIHSPTPHEYTRTGHLDTKFGIPADEAMELYAWAAGRASLRAVGVDVHVGSQIVEPGPYLDALGGVLDLADRLRSELGLPIEFVDLGGGFGVDDDRGPGIDLEALGSAVVGLMADTGLRLILEPGRYLVAEAGLLVTRVLLVKRSRRKEFVVTDGGMTELLRPSHYGGFHEIVPVRVPVGVASDPGDDRRVVDVVGPICETGDFLARDRELRVPETGEYLAVRTAGAYGFAMASNYNARRRPAEVLVDGDAVRLIRTRESYEDLIRGETLPGNGES